MTISSPAAATIGETAKLGNEILSSRIEPTLSAQDMGKFVAIAVDNGQYEIDASDQAAIARLLARHPHARLWLARAGLKAAYRIGLR